MNESCRDCPFLKGERYKVKRTFVAMRDNFQEGEVLTFDGSAWSRYDGISGFFFSQPGVKGLRVWDIYDDEPLETWRDFFEPAG